MTEDDCKRICTSTTYKRLLKSLQDAGWEQREAVIIVLPMPKRIRRKPNPKWKYF